MTPLNKMAIATLNCEIGKICKHSKRKGVKYYDMFHDEFKVFYKKAYTDMGEDQLIILLGFKLLTYITSKGIKTKYIEMMADNSMVKITKTYQLPITIKNKN